MALTNLAIQNNVQAFQQGQVGSLFGLAQDGDVQAVNKVSGAADYIFTGNTAGAETVNFSVTFATLLKLYSAQISGQTRLVIQAKISARSAAVATSDYWEVFTCWDDIAGTMTTVNGTESIPVSIEGAATTDPDLTNSGSNTLQIAVTTLAAAAVRVELFVNHVQ